MIETEKWYYLRENTQGSESKECRVRMDLNGDALVFCFEVADKELCSPYTQDNEDIWQGDAVEVFLSPDGDRKHYLELEVSPYGVRFFGEVENLDGKTCNLKKIAPRFTAQAMETECGYRVVMRLPVAAAGKFDAKKAVMNAFRLDKKADGRQLLYALNPTFCESFHRPAYFI